MSTLIASALVAGFFILSGAHAASAPAAPVPVLPAYSVSLTSYNAVPGQTDDDPMTTASGLRSNPEVIAARSVDLRDELPFGTVIKISPTEKDNPKCHFDPVADQIGYRVVGDSMNSRLVNRVDILLDPAQKVTVDGKAVNPARALGICSNVTVQVVGYVDLKDVPATQEELAKMVTASNLAVKEL